MEDQQPDIDCTKQQPTNDKNLTPAIVCANRLGGTTTSAMTKDLSPILVLINPHSGCGKALSIYVKKLKPFLSAHGIEHRAFITQRDYRVYDFLAKKDLKELLSYRSIVVLSGDGLVHEAVNALLNRDDWSQISEALPIGIVPTGSGNGLAYTLVRLINPQVRNANEAIQICLQQLHANKKSATNLVRISYQPPAAAGTPHKVVYSFLSFGWGLLSDIDIDSEWLRCLGEIRFTVYGILRSATAKSRRGRLTFKIAPGDEAMSPVERQRLFDSSTSRTTFGTKNENDAAFRNSYPQNVTNEDSVVFIEDRFSCIYAVYQSYISSKTKFSPKSKLADQLIYLTYIRGKLNFRQTLDFLLALDDGSFDKLPYVEVVPVTKFILEPLEASRLVVDGELIAWDLQDGPVEAEVIPNHLKLLHGKD